MSHHHNMSVLVKINDSYFVKTENKKAVFSKKKEEANRFRYWKFAFSKKEDICSELGINISFTDKIEFEILKQGEIQEFFE